MEIEEAKAVKYPDAVIGTFYRKNFDWGYFRHPLCVFFTEEYVDDEPYPFYTKRVNDQNAKSGSRINFLTYQDADDWKNGENVFLAKEETIAIRIDIDGDIPCYADLSWLKTFDPSVIHPVIRKRMKKEPVLNPFLSKEDREKREKEFGVKNGFVEAIKSKYAGTTFDGKLVKIPFEGILPSTPLKNGHLTITIRKNSWVLSSYNHADIDPFVLSDACIKKAQELQADFLKRSYIIRDEFLHEVEKETNISSFYPSSYKEGDIRFSFQLNDDWSIRAEKEDGKGRITIEPRHQSPKSFDVSSVISCIDMMKEALTGDYKQAKAVEKCIHDFDPTKLVEMSHIKADWVKDNKVADLIKPEYLSEEQKEFFSDYLLENFEKELKANDIKGVLKGIENAELNYRQNYIKDSGFLYAYFWEELGIDLFKALNNDLKPLLDVQYGYGSERLNLTYSVHNKDMILSKELLDKNSNLNVFVKGVDKVIIGEGTTSVDNLTMSVNAYGKKCVLILPTSMTGRLKVASKFRDCYLGFKPIDIDGEKASSFTVYNLEYEQYKDDFIAM